MQISLFVSIIYFCLTYLSAEDKTLESIPIGIKIQIKDKVIPGPELEAKPLTKESAVVLRIKGVYPHGNAFRYDYEYYGLEPGSYDLGNYFQSKTNKPLINKPKLPILFKSSLPQEQIKPNPPGDGQLPHFTKYKNILIIGATIWLFGLLFLIFYGRKKLNLIKPSTDESLSPAEILLPLVKAAKQGNLGKNDQAKLERTLILFWSNQLNLNDKSPKIILSTIKSHPEAKPLFQKLESWFHSPQPEEPSDLDALLEPYSKPKIN